MATKDYTPSDELPIVNYILIEERRKNNPKAPWKNKRALEAENKAEEITPEEIYQDFLSIDNLRDRCLAAILYICGARVGEIVRKKVWKYGKKEAYLIRKNKKGRGTIPDYSNKKLIKELPSIKKSDIYFYENEYGKMVRFRIRNEKNRDPKRRTKEIVIPLNSEMNKKFVNIIKQYLLTLREHEELFPIEQRRAEQIFAEFEINTHFFRELRLTHLAKFNNFTDQQLVFFSGWTDSRPSKNYIKMRPEDLIHKL